MIHKEFCPLEKTSGSISMVINFHNYDKIKLSYNCKPSFTILTNDAKKFFNAFSFSIKHLYVFDDEKIIFEFLDKG